MLWCRDMTKNDEKQMWTLDEIRAEYPEAYAEGQAVERKQTIREFVILAIGIAVSAFLLWYIAF